MCVCVCVCVSYWQKLTTMTEIIGTAKSIVLYTSGNPVDCQYFNVFTLLLGKVVYV